MDIRPFDAAPFQAEMTQWQLPPDAGRSIIK